MGKNKNYIYQVLYTSISILAVLLSLSFIPESVYEEWGMKPIDILSDIRAKDTTNLALIDSVDLPEIVQKPFVDSCRSDLICFDDFSEEGNGLERFFESLNNIDSLGRPVRVAFMGDSYIEGDIFSSELRAKLQDRFGGNGVGFVNISSQTSGFRKTLKHSFSGWSRYSVVDTIRPSYAKLSISGNYFVADTFAWASFSGVNIAHLDTMYRAKIIFSLAGSPTNINYRVNKSKTQPVKLIPSGNMQMLTVDDTISSFSFNTTPHGGLTFHGVSLESPKGVIVDNFSLRGSPGTATAYIPEKNLKDIDSLLNYDLVILQYGLNSITKTNMNYASYKEKMIKTVERIQKNFPNADILLLSIGDRGIREKGEYITMPSIPFMVKYQRAICSETEIVFWDMFHGMGGEGSMIEMVETKPPLANKDYTHLTFAGGAYLGNMLYETLMYEKQRYERRKAYEKENPDCEKIEKKNNHNIESN